MTTMLRAAEDSPTATPLAAALRAALDADDPAAIGALAGESPAGRRDRLATLAILYDLHTAPLDRLGPAARHQHHPALAALKARAEADWLAELDALTVPAPVATAMAAGELAAGALAADTVVAAMRALAAHDRLPAVYKWLAREADPGGLRRFLALEGGPDAGFDDLVASCQIGLRGAAKMELARNYWDEMGDGDPAAVHTTLHDELAAALDLPAVPVDAQPTSAIARSALGGLLATNRWLQPEMLGALGLIELQAGPRCRLVVQALARCQAPAAAYPFYEVHADVDPRHGKDWLEKAIAPLAAEHPDWAPRMVRGALWRSAVDAAFLADAAELLGATEAGAAGDPPDDAAAGSAAA